MSDNPVPARTLPEFTPVPRKRMRRGGWSPERQRAFIEALAETGSVRSACRALGVGEHHIYKLRRHPEAASFRAAWEAALDLGIQRIEDVAMERALNGVEVPVYHGGEIIGTRRAYNDRLLMFMLERRAPGRFGKGAGNSIGGVDPGWKGRETIRIRKRLKRRLKKKWRQKWRAQWEKERAERNGSVSVDEIRASIDRKVEGFRRASELQRQREWETLSEETRAAWDHFEELRNRDLDAMKADEEKRRRLERGPRQ